MNKARTRLVALGLSAGLVGGGAAGMILGTPGLSGAQYDATISTVVDDEPARGHGPDRLHPSERLAEILAPLVEDGTITQAQADAVIEAIVDAGPPPRGRHRGGRPGPGWRAGRGLDAAAEVLGMSRSDLVDELRRGRTIAQVAETKGVEVQTVIDAMVAEVREHLDEKVADGELTRAQADRRLAEVTERITEMVNEGPRRFRDRDETSAGGD